MVKKVGKKRIGALLLGLVLLAGTAPLRLQGAEAAYTGIPEGMALIRNASYSDIKGNPNGDSIMKMSIYSLVREYGGSQYRPDLALSRQDALASLVRTIGRQEDAVRRGEQLKLQDSRLSSEDAYMRGHIELAQSSGIVQSSEITALGALTAAETAAVKSEADRAKKNNWKMTTAEYNQLIKEKTDQRSFDKAYKVPVRREEAALWIARAMELQPVKAEDTKAVFNYRDWPDIKTENIPYVEAVLAGGIMKGTTAGFLPAGTISRGEWAAIINTVAAASLDKLGFTTGYGKVTDIRVARDIDAMQNQTATEITVQNPSSDVINIKVTQKAGLTASPEEALPVIKNGELGSEALLAEGDIVEYTLTGSNEALLLYVSALKEVSGTFIGYDYRQNLAQLADKNGNSYSLKVMPDSIILAQREPVDIGQVMGNVPATAVYANGILKSLNLEVPTEKVKNEETAVKILYADTLGRIVKVMDEMDNIQYLNLAEDAAVYINGERQGIDAIGFDQDAVLKVADGRVLEVRVYSDVPAGAEESFTREITGRIRSISGGGITLAADDDPDKPLLYKADGSTVVVKDGKTVELSKLRQGDRAKIYVSSLQDQHIARLEVQGEGALIDKVYRGDIMNVLPSTREVILGNVYSYGYYDWVKADGYLKFKLSGDAELYDGNAKLDINKLRDYTGKSLYAVSHKDYGEPELTKAVLKEGAEDTLFKNISGIKWTARQMALSDGRTVGFKDGTIVIRDGRLLDTLDLAADENAFIIQNRQSDIGSAAVISLDSFNGFSNFRIVKGYLHNMGEDYYTVENGYQLSNNDWQEDTEMTFQLSDETYIYDNVFVKGVITVDKFTESRYKPYTYIWPNYATSHGSKDFHEDDQYHYDYDRYKSSSRYHEHCMIYVVADQYGLTQAINIYTKDKDSFKPDKVSAERMIAGVLERTDTNNKIITLKDARDYSPVYDRWQPLKTSISTSAGKAVILKDGRQVALADLETDDQIYILSNSGSALFILAED